MKKYLLLGIGFLCFIASYGQKGQNPKDEFIYKTIKIIDKNEGALPITGAPNEAINSEENTKLSGGASSGVGETLGELSVSLTGGATYDIPIAVPPGINGVTPEISLTYNSQSGNGLAGFGWNLSGVSVISRIPSTKFHDNIIDPTNFDDLDRFSLDGQRLVLKSGTYGKNGAQYQTENYSNLKIISYGTSSYGANFGPAYFIAYYPDGSFAHYGNSTDSRSQMNYAITYWQNPQGVRISYEYIKENNSLSISKIKYGSRNTSSPINEIQFLYAPRQRTEQAYIGNIAFERDDILNKIKVLGGGVGYRNYYLTHDRTSLKYQRLTSFQEKSGNNILSHSAIQFNYSNSSSSVNYTGITTVGLNNIEQRNAETISLDLTGNGKMDFIVYPKPASQKNKFWIATDIQSGSSNSVTEVNSGPFEAIFPVSWLNHSNKILAGQGLSIIQNTSNNGVKFKVYGKAPPSAGGAPIAYQYEKIWSVPTYSSTYSCTVTPSVNRVPQKYLSGDFNGDGLSDIIAVSKPYSYTECGNVPCDDDGGGGWPLLKGQATNTKDSITTTKSTLRSFDGCCECNTTTVNISRVNFINLDRRITSGFTSSAGYLPQGLKSTDKLLTADVNGDGKTDILHITKGKISVYTLNSSNSLQLLWQTTDTRIKLDYPLLLGDYNGDGRIDFMTPINNNSNFFISFLSTGTRFLNTGSKAYPFTYKQNDWNGSSATLYGYNLIPIDINGDGRTDIIDYRTKTYNNSTNGSQTVYIYNNEGMSINSSSALLAPSLVSGGSTTKTGNLKHFPIPIFLTSDKPNKSLDFASISNNWITSFTFSQDHREDVLLRSIENNGITQSINYNNLDPNEYSSDMPVYQFAYSESYPNVDLKIAPGTKVVSSLQRIYSSTPTLKQIYSYYGAVYNMEGLGFLGFQGIAKSNWHTDNSDRIFNVSKYNPQLRGAITDEYVQPYNFSFTSIPSDYISKTSYTNASSLAANKVFKLWNTSSVTQNSLNGTVINKSFLYDTYNNPTRITTNFSGYGSSVIDITYANSTGSTYYIGRPTSEKETTTIGSNAFSTERQFSYSGYLLTQKKTKGNGTQFDTESYTYDVFGNITKKITTPYNTPAREVRLEYDTSGRYLTKSYDLEGLATTYLYNTNIGTLTKETNPFGQDTQYFYDAWNRLTKVTDYLGKNVTSSYVESGNTYTVTVSADDGSGKITIYDPLKRVTTVKEKDVLGQWISKSYQYDKFDRVAAESEPYTGSGASQWNTTEYDFYGRPKTISSYTGKVSNISYSNLSVTIDDGTKTVTTTKNAMGNIIRVTDPGGTINYTYYGNGTMKTANYDGVVISTEQDGWGRKTKTTDPSAGVYTYEYNGFGEITKETTPKGATDYTYTSIGKLQQKKVVGDLTNMTLQYAYNTTNKMISSISLTNSDGNNSTYDYRYDNNQRLNYISESNPYAQFTKRYRYDTFGRIDTEESTARLLANGRSSIKSIKNTYQNGSLKTISDTGTQEVLWNVDALNARGQATSITMGNNLRKKHVYNPLGFLTESTSEKDINAEPTQLMKLTFDFDTQRGNLNSRTNSLFSWTENFTYDNIDRLVSFNDNNGNNNHSYDTKGRITVNNTIGTYNYSGNSYQLAGIDLNNSGRNHYDQDTRQDISYNAFKSPVEIHEADKDKVSFQYNAFMGRANTFYGSTENDKLLRPNRRHYSYDGSMEISYNQTTGESTFVTYIGGDAYNAPAIWRSEQGSTTTNGYYFLYRDYLGSILMISDKNGAVKEKRHFDAWGNIVKLQDGNGNDLSSFNILDRGYTGHEHLLGVGLIHMNGRLYDPLLHRFLAPDNYIQNPYSTQNYNRYGYVLNNPLKYTDPSGEFILEGIAAIYYIIAAVIVAAAAIWGNPDTGWSSPNSTPQTPTSNQNNSQNSAASAEVPPIPGSGYRLDNPYGVLQSAMLQSNTSSGIAYATTGPNDWIANGSNLGGQEQQIARPQKINYSKSRLEILGSFINWYHYIENNSTDVLYPEDIIDFKTIKSRGNLSSKNWTMTGSVTRKEYRDAGGSARLGIVEQLAGFKQNPNHVAAYVDYVPLKGSNPEQFHFKIIMQDGTSMLSLHITGNDLAERIKRAIYNNGFFKIKDKFKD
ncbi:MAG: FG-GAP-like repeat-containing protein [Flavobacteriaceae bacterium]|nr:FG-GAP-like repeat-containing protein [Flavobacteriaceae bacterium]